MTANRVAMGETVLELAREDERICIVESDIAGSVNFTPFIQTFPERHFDCGIAEQNMVGVAAGLASCGYIPFVASFAVFASMRALDQVRNALCYNHFPVVVVGSHAGLETGPDGATHQAVEDVAIMRAVPGITVLAPSTPVMTRALTRAAAYAGGPVYLRLGRDKMEEHYEDGEKFEIGGSKMLKEGEDVAIMAYGNMVTPAMRAAEQLKEKGVSASVIDMYSLKPFDEARVIAEGKSKKVIITAEDHNIIGGLFGAVAETLAKNGIGCKTAPVGVEDKLGKAGNSADLFRMYGLTAENIVKTTLETL